MLGSPIFGNPQVAGFLSLVLRRTARRSMRLHRALPAGRPGVHDEKKANMGALMIRIGFL